MSDTTTTNIPTTDPALLAAQAKAGQAGVDAYNAAINTLQQQKQQSVQQAMTSAAARGISPPGADVGGDVGRMYDSRIGQLQAGLGQYQANTAARGQRLSDYNAAVTSARSLIPGQVAIATAPIKAQGEFDVYKIDSEGREKVDAINAQQRLVAAQMEAAKLAAARSGGGGRGGGGGGGGGTKLTGTNAQQVIADAANQLSEAYAAPAQQAAQTAPTRGDTEAARQASSFTGNSQNPAYIAATTGQTLAQVLAEMGQAAQPENPQATAGPGSGGLIGALMNPVKQSLQGISSALQSRSAATPAINQKANVARNQSAVQRALASLGYRVPGVPQIVGPASPATGGSPYQQALAAQRGSLGVNPDFTFPTIVAPEGTPWAGHEVGTLESIMAPLGVAPGALSGSMKYPEQQAAAQRALEEAQGIGTSAYRAAGQQGIDALTKAGFNIPSADQITALNKLGGTTYDDASRAAQGLDKNPTPQAAVAAAVKDQQNQLNQTRNDAANTRTDAANALKDTETQDNTVFAGDWNGANLDDVAKAAGKSRQWVKDAAAQVANSPALKAATYDKLAGKFQGSWKKADLNSAINDIINSGDVAKLVPSKSQAQQIGVLLRGLFEGSIGG